MDTIALPPSTTTTSSLKAAKALKKEESQIRSRTLAKIYRAMVVDAYKNRRIFTVFGNFNTIRRSLLRRGWLEKLPANRHSNLQSLSEEKLLLCAQRGNDYEAVAISKIIKHLPAFFVWQPKTKPDYYMDVYPYRNRIRRSHALDFSTKVGLIGCAEQQHWFQQDGTAGMCYPRFFRLGANHEELEIFKHEYRITQCCSLLRFLALSLAKQEGMIDCEKGALSIKVPEFALSQAKRFLEEGHHFSSLDVTQSQVSESEWSQFLDDSSHIINNGQRIKCTFRELADIVKTSKVLITKMEERQPDLKWDGYKNLWILKPGYQSRGLGIVIRNKLSEILQWCTANSGRHYVVQKYIEQPLLIYRTKFDIRQYMLLFIRKSTVQIWLYADCYLRFCSQEYSLDDFKESVHLTNNSVQKKYKNKANRDSRLPKNNMWSLDQFKAYLKTKKVSEDVWDKRIFAGFRENLVAVVLSSLDETDLNENAFELYGCDFMLDEEYRPILIEINSSPDLSPSTDVTARICPMVMEDCIKVIVDLPRNSRARTGRLQKVYEVSYKFEHDPNNTEALKVNGKSVQLYKQARPVQLPKIPRRPKTETKKPAKWIPEQKVFYILTNPPDYNEVIDFIYKTAKADSSRCSVSSSGPKGLMAAAKEALALRYTMPT